MSAEAVPPPVRPTSSHRGLIPTVPMPSSSPAGPHSDSVPSPGSSTPSPRRDSDSRLPDSPMRSFRSCPRPRSSTSAAGTAPWPRRGRTKAHKRHTWRCPVGRTRSEAASEQASEPGRASRVCAEASGPSPSVCPAAPLLPHLSQRTRWERSAPRRAVCGWIRCCARSASICRRCRAFPPRHLRIPGPLRRIRRSRSSPPTHGSTRLRPRGWHRARMPASPERSSPRTLSLTEIRSSASPQGPMSCLRTATPPLESS